MFPEIPQSRSAVSFAGVLVELLKLQETWAYFFASGGRQYRDSIAELKDGVARHLETLFAVQKVSAVPKERSLDSYSISEIVFTLDNWDAAVGALPLKSEVASCWWMAGMGHLVFYLKRLAGIPDKFLPKISMTSAIFHLSEGMSAIRHHLPKHINVANIQTADDVVAKLRSTDCIALFGDLRNSQDLMNFTVPPEDFFNRLFLFTAAVRDVAATHGAVFDKFTGDGFLVLFSEGIYRNCRHTDKYKVAFLDFVVEIQRLAAHTFDDWRQHVSETPDGGYGLSMGADIGQITADFEQRELRVLGEPLVLASRFTSAARPGELLVSTRLKEALAGVAGCQFRERQCDVKRRQFVGWTTTPAIDAETYELLKFAKEKQTTTGEARSMFNDRKLFPRSWDNWSKEERVQLTKFRDAGKTADQIARAMQRVPKEIKLNLDLESLRVGSRTKDTE